MNKSNIDIRLGDAYTLIKILPTASIDCIYTDIPYLYEKKGTSERERESR